jgi:hypothetical protein
VVVNTVETGGDAGVRTQPGIQDLSEEEIPGAQHGGHILAGAPYIVGERGPELFVPDRSGTVVPNQQAFFDIERLERAIARSNRMLIMEMITQLQELV